MPRFSQVQEEACVRIRQLAVSGLSPGELAHRILRALLFAIPADGAAVFGIDPGSLLINRLLAVVGNAPDETLFWIRHVYLANEPIPQFTFPSLMARNIGVVTLRDKTEACWGMPPTALSHLTPHQFRNAYHDIGTPAGGGMRAWFEADERKFAALQMIRSDAAHPFQVGDWQFLHKLRPIIGRALASALAREEGAMTNPSSNPLSAGVLALTPEGRIILQSATSEQWLQVLTRNDGAAPGASVIGGLPIVVWSVVSGLRAKAGSGAIHEAVRVLTAFGPLRVEASPADDEGAIAVTLVPERPPAPPELPLSWQLTPQERRVLMLVANGMTNRQIAHTLVVSDNTVESHLRHAYEKLSVNSRTQYLARLYQETYWPLHKPE
jgi:DNA-binding CsgD family transcriptional regulator